MCYVLVYCAVCKEKLWTWNYEHICLHSGPLSDKQRIIESFKDTTRYGNLCSCGVSNKFIYLWKCDKD